MKERDRVEARRRLLGTWRSDRRRTERNWVFPRKLAMHRLREFRAMFGKLTWHFSVRSVTETYDELTWRYRYSILWADEHSAVVVFSNAAEEKCHQLFFDEKWFYLVGGRAGNVEYFRRIDV
jgi:hypothetical protein